MGHSRDPLNCRRRTDPLSAQIDVTLFWRGVRRGLFKPQPPHGVHSLMAEPLLRGPVEESKRPRWLGAARLHLLNAYVGIDEYEKGL